VRWLLNNVRANGVLFLILSIFAGILWGAKVASSVGFGMLAFVAANYWFMQRSIRSLAVTQVSAQESAREDDSVTFVVSLKNTLQRALDPVLVRAKFAGSYPSECYRTTTAIGALDTCHVELTFPCNRGAGTYVFCQLSVTVRDPFGIFYRSWSEETTHTVIVYPNPKELPLRLAETGNRMSFYDTPHSLAAGSSTTFFGNRPWQNGDSMRHVDWKRTAQKGELIVKEYERQVEPLATIVFDDREQGHADFANLSSFAALRSACLGAALSLSNRRLRYQLITSSTVMDYGSGDVQYELAESTLAQNGPRRSAQFSDIVRQLSEAIPEYSVVLFFLSSAQISQNNLLAALQSLKDLNCTISLFVTDAVAYQAAVAAAMKLEAQTSVDIYEATVKASLPLKVFASSDMIHSFTVVKPSGVAHG
jgi:uncharacterized protein (DUF58 family)